jgi:DNA polymerase-1
VSDRIVLIDGHALVYRAYHALPPLTSTKGEVVNAVYGFMSMLIKVCGDLKPRYLTSAFDTSAQTFRRDEFEAYKATRPPAPEGMPVQFAYVYRLLEAMRVPVHRLEGYEADDLLGTLSCRAAELGLDVIILTGDMDALQLVGPNVRVLTSRRGFSDTVLYDEQAVRDRYGLEPLQLVDFKALRGDVSDNIPGVPGIGDKTASRLLATYGSVEQLYAHLSELPEKQRALLEPYGDQVIQSKRLVTVVCDLDVDLDLPSAELRDFELSVVQGLLRELGFRSLVDRVPEVLGPGKVEQAQRSPSVRPERKPGGQLPLFGQPPADSQASSASDRDESKDGEGVVATSEAVGRLTESLRSAGGFSLAAQGSLRDPMRADLVGLALAADEAAPSYLPLAHAEGPNLQSDDGEASERLPSGVRAALEDPALRKYAHDAKSQMVLLARQGVELRGLEFDTMIAAYLLASSQRALELRDLAWSRLQEEVPPLASLIGSGKSALTLREVAVNRAAEHARREAELVCRLVPVFARELAECGQEQLFREVELPLVPVLAAMELVGVAIDVPYLQELSRELYDRLRKLETDVFSHVGHEFNINSTRQLADVLYDELKLPRSKKTASGQGSTGAEVLEVLRTAHPCVELILEHRQLQKLKSTYVDALPLLAHPDTGRVHTYFNQTIAATGRLSSSEPNLQNIPIRTEVGRRVRRSFIPGEPGCSLLSADYSQIELRILAHETQDPRLLQAFREGQDIHAATAAEVMGVDLGQVTPDMRRFAKVVNFGVLYGMSEFGLASRTDLPSADAAGFIQRYFERFGTVKDYQERIVREAEQTGYVETLLKRRRYLPELRSSNYAVRQGAIRAAVNHPFQGAASDVMKIAMIRIHSFIRERQLKTRMLLQVHDELVFESPVQEIQVFKDDLRRIMMGAMDLSVPLEVELKTGPNWDQMTPVEHA